LYAAPPRIPKSPPRLTAIEAIPERLVPGRSNFVEIVVDFEYINMNVGPTEARILRTVRKISGNFNLSTSVKTIKVPVEVFGKKGQLITDLNIEIPFRAKGVLEIEIAIYDESGLLSSPLAVKVFFP